MYHFRREKIKDYVDQKKIVSMKELSLLCPDVTLMTLHRDLDALQQAGFLQKVRGGARAASSTVETSFYARSKVHVERKARIAERATELIKPGSSVFIDAGTTCQALIRALPDVDFTLFTTGANFAPDFARLMYASVNICCGSLNCNNMALSGNGTLEYLDGVNIDICFIGVSGHSPSVGFTCGKESEMLVKRHVIRKSRTSVLLMDRSKTTRIMPYTFATFADIQYIITDAPLPDEFVMEARRYGKVQILS
jgi:DeoR family transcriptional regulator of aga operon